MNRKTSPESTEEGKTVLDSNQLVWSAMIVLLGIEVMIVLLDLYQHFTPDVPSPIRSLLNITREDTFGTWFSSTQAFIVAIILWINFARVRAEGHAKLGAWGIVAAFFTYASLDDGSRLHERIGSSIDSPIFDLFPSYPWQVIFVPTFVLVGLVILYLIFRDMNVRFAKVAVLMGLALSGTAAVGIDFLEGVPNYSDLEFADFLSDENPHVRHLFKVLEEFLEMVGITLFLVGFGKHVATRYSEWNTKFK